MSKNLEQRVTELEKLVKELRKDKFKKIVENLGVGDTFELAGLKWKILDITEKEYKCLAERLEDNMKFDSKNNDWKTSDLRNYLNTDFYKKLAAEIGEENIIPFERDLLSLDGQTEYGKCEDKVSLLTVDEYRKYRNLIPNTDKYWWWLISPWSTPCNDYYESVTVVSPSGCISNYYFNFNCGFRPFVSFSSTIFESEE